MRVIVSLILLFVFAGNGFCQATYHEDYLIPNDYVGWVRVMHEVENAPPLPVENERTVFKFDESGILRTSDEVHEGSIYARYYHYTETTKILLPNKAEGAGGAIHNKSVINTKLLDFFVGSDEEYSLWYQSDCGKAPFPFDHAPGNIKQCLKDFENSRQHKRPELDVAPEVPAAKSPSS